jgi:hypothetical protein
VTGPFFDNPLIQLQKMHGWHVPGRHGWFPSQDWAI